jgi:hypothetical protein
MRLVVEHQHASGFVPLRKHKTLDGRTVDLDSMHGGPVGMTVYQTYGPVLRKNRFDRFLVDIHNFIAFAELVIETPEAVPARVGQSQKQRFPQNFALPLRTSGFSAELQIRKIIGAQEVAVHQQSPPAIQINHRIVLDEFDAGFIEKALSDQKIPVALLEIDHSTRVGKLPQRRFDLFSRRRGVIVPDPGIEEISEDIQGRGTFRAVLQKIEELPGDRRSGRSEMKIGDKERFREHDSGFKLGLEHERFLNNDIGRRHVLMPVARAGRYALHPLNHIHSFHDLPKNGIAPSLHRRGTMI